MLKTKNKASAIEHAVTNKLQYGLCVFDGFYYTGTPDQLEKVGAVTPKIQSMPEQSQAAKDCGKAYCCLGYRPGENWTWFIVLATDSEWEADDWWARQPSMARVYYGNGKIRNAK